MEERYSGSAAVTAATARAGFWPRFAAALIDGIVIAIVSGVAQVIFGQWQGYAVGIVVSLAYYTYFHGSRGQTPGDSAVSLRVVDKDGGGSIGYGRAFVRWLVSHVSFVVFLLGYLWMLWDSEKQTWHDKAANAVVVQKT